MVRQGLEGLLAPIGIVDEIFPFKKGGVGTSVPPRLREREYQCVLCPHESLRSSILVSKMRSTQKVGFDVHINKILFSHVVKKPEELPDALRQLSLLRGLDPKIEKLLSAAKVFFGARSVHTQNWAFQPDRPKIDPLLAMAVDKTKIQWDELSPRVSPILQNWKLQKQKVIAIAPGSVWATKRWPLEKFVSVVKKMPDHKFVLVGSESELPLANEIQGHCPDVLNAVGETSLRQMWTLLDACDGLFSNDSGLMHMASCLGLPTVVVFGPTTLNLGYRPWQDGAVVVQTELACRPCGSHGSVSCPIGTHACMEQVQPDQVVEAWKKLSSQVKSTTSSPTPVL